MVLFVIVKLLFVQLLLLVARKLEDAPGSLRVKDSLKSELGSEPVDKNTMQASVYGLTSPASSSSSLAFDFLRRPGWETRPYFA